MIGIAYVNKVERASHALFHCGTARELWSLVHIVLWIMPKMVVDSWPVGRGSLEDIVVMKI